MPEKSQYKSLAEWKKANPNDYYIAYKNGWLDEICEKFGWVRFKQRKPNGYWTEKRVIAEAKKHKTISEWVRNSPTTNEKARYRFYDGFYEKCTAHMDKLKPAGFWIIKENCIEEAKKYNSREEWQEKSVTSYNFAERNYWLGECKPIIINYDLIKQWNKSWKNLNINH